MTEFYLFQRTIISSKEHERRLAMDRLMRGLQGSRAVFLDRDGVIIEDVHYLRQASQLRIIPGAAAAIRRLRHAGLKVIVVSNQSAIARGLISRSGVDAVHRLLNRRLRQRGARIDAIYYCPHHPGFGRKRACACRKPAIGMLKAAARRFKLDIARCYLVGDTTTDIRAARNAGCAALLVKTGKGGRDRAFRIRPDRAFRDLSQASRWIVSREKKPIKA
ncbi:MAG: HAD family hydrolase [Elusimicrobia bacterium]|nr:HAD family hydrolase [Elusimicrobiota bacterium]